MPILPHISTAPPFAQREISAAERTPPALSLPADLLTPVSAYLSLRPHTTASFLFESVEGGERIARYSFIGIDPLLVIESTGGVVTVTRGGTRERAAGDLFSTIRDILGPAVPPPGREGPDFSTGLVGYVGYDEVRSIERIPSTLPDTTGAPDSLLGIFGTTIVFDHRDHTIAIVQRPGVPRGERRLTVAEVRELLKAPPTSGRPFSPVPGSALSPSVPPEFPGTVRTALRRIREGEIFQVVLSCRNTIPFEGDPFQVYRALRMINPSPYHYYLDFGTARLIGSSPEMLVKKTGSRVEHVPIAGTRPRGSTPAEDAAAERELLADEKERAEHVMLVDLGRNDLSKICVPGTVRVGRLMEVERYSHVMHMVSRVTGTCLPGTDAVDALRAVFPAGTVSGAPKIRAMEIIDELESVKRGFYAGAVGYFDASGNAEFCIAIRTILAAGGRLHLQAGAGIVNASEPSREREEIAGKMRALYDAVCLAKGIDA